MAFFGGPLRRLVLRNISSIISILNVEMSASSCRSYSCALTRKYFPQICRPSEFLILTRQAHKLSISDENVQNYMASLAEKSENSQHDNPHLQGVVQKILEKMEELKELNNLVKENQDLKEIAASDAQKLENELKLLEERFFENIVPPEPLDRNDVAIEVAAGVGGQEAMLFAQELFEMYEHFSSYKGMEWTVTSFETTESGGIRRASANVSGIGAFKLLKFEGGVHRVQRVPKTEKAGRVHTSTATVAILPVPRDVDVVINSQDLIFEAKKASGAGGQHVNTTESAVRLTHKPTGIVIECQMGRSQIRNREVALLMLRTKIYEARLKEQESMIRQKRKLQVGLSGRSEKIRTYNFPQDRCTDHRIGFTTQNLKDVLVGEDYFNNIVQHLLEFDKEERLQQLFASNQSSVKEKKKAK